MEKIQKDRSISTTLKCKVSKHCAQILDNEQRGSRKSNLRMSLKKKKTTTTTATYTKSIYYGFSKVKSFAKGISREEARFILGCKLSRWSKDRN